MHKWCNGSHSNKVICRSSVHALSACLPRQDHVWITTNQLVLFHKKEFDEMLCKLDSAENPRSCEKYSTRTSSELEIENHILSKPKHHIRI